MKNYRVTMNQEEFDLFTKMLDLTLRNGGLASLGGVVALHNVVTVAEVVEDPREDATDHAELVDVKEE